ncbi:MAG: NAD(P)/FAD-dependent oxidoreductase [Chitinophagales bacterium]|nr:NAD(P)/FAD-dependent oxidoreductase [Hyphomicrobiales bacterium]
MMEKLLIIGNGMASTRLLDELVKRPPGRFAITVVGAEQHASYNRVLLSPMLAGEIGWNDVRLKPEGWYEANSIKLERNNPAVILDPVAKAVKLADGRALSYDKCVLATGSEPIRLPIPGANFPGVTTFRTAADCADMTARALRGEPAVVIGGGLLGIEAAYGLARLGLEVTLVHIMDRLMERQLDAEAAAMLKTAVETKGIRVVLGAQTAAIEGDGAVSAVTLKDDSQIRCGLVVMAAGVRPETALARQAGLAVNRGVLIDDAMATSGVDIYAIGECSEHRGRCYGLVEPAHEQARALAARLTGDDAVYEGSVLATNLKVSGVPVFSAGDFEGEGASAIVLRDKAMGVYRKLVVRDGKLAGAVLFGDTSDALWYLGLIRSGAAIAPIRRDLAFGQAYAEAA